MGAGWAVAVTNGVAVGPGVEVGVGAGVGLGGSDVGSGSLSEQAASNSRRASSVASNVERDMAGDGVRILDGPGWHAEERAEYIIDTG